MGIKNINKLLKKYDIHHEIHISIYQYKKIAIDVSNFMYKYKFVYGDDWMIPFIQLITCLRRNNIHCIFIFDSIAPKEKKLEQQRRRENREKDKQRLNNIENDYNEYLKSGNISETLIKLSQRLNKNIPNKRLLGFVNDSYNNSKINMNTVYDYIQKNKNRKVDISSNDFELSKNLFDILGVPYIYAISEAETIASDLCKRGIVDAVLSEDTDVLAYGSPILLNNINTSTDTCIEIKLDNILNELELNYDEFLDLCILCGTDYNNNLEGIGVINSYKLIKKYKSIDNFNLDININNKFQDLDKELNYIKIRDMFKNYQKLDINIEFCKKPNWNELQKLLFINNCNYDISYIKKFYNSPDIVLLD
jgi:5'-3' exonuclease